MSDYIITTHPISGATVYPEDFPVHTSHLVDVFTEDSCLLASSVRIDDYVSEYMRHQREERFHSPITTVFQLSTGECIGVTM